MTKQVSKKQAQKNRAIAKIKSKLSPFCFSCHNLYDNDLLFRQQQTEIFNRICEFDEIGAVRYFKL